MENDKIEPRYMNSTKKHYYLASVNENVQQLVKQEIDGLTAVLIDLKSQYDIISKESIEKKLQTEELTKKIPGLGGGETGEETDTEAENEEKSAEENGNE